MFCGSTPLPFDPRTLVGSCLTDTMCLKFFGREVNRHFEMVTSPSLLRLFACRCAEMILEVCKNPEQEVIDAIEVGRRYALGQASMENLRAAHERSSIVVRRYIEIVPNYDDSMADACSEDELRRERGWLRIVRFAAEAAHACTVQPGRVAAVGALYCADMGMGSDAGIQAKEAIKRLAQQWLDGGREWRPVKEEHLLRATLEKLPEGVSNRILSATDTALRVFACRCATDALDTANDVDPMYRQTVEMAERFTRGQVSAAEMEAAGSAARAIVAAKQEQEVLMADTDQTYSPDLSRLNAQGGAEYAAVYCTSASAGLAAAYAADEAIGTRQRMAFAEHEERWIALAKEIFEGG